jgi:hypothetical protein
MEFINTKHGKTHVSNNPLPVAYEYIQCCFMLGHLPKITNNLNGSWTVTTVEALPITFVQQ